MPEGDTEQSQVEFRNSREDPELFLSFANLGAHGEPSNKSIEEWVRQYGFLRMKEDSFSKPDAMTVADFRAEVLCAYQLLSLYRHAKTWNIDALRAMIVEAKRHPSSEWPNTPSTAMEKVLAAFREAVAEAAREDIAKYRADEPGALDEKTQRDLGRVRRALDNGWLAPDSPVGFLPEGEVYDDESIIDFAWIYLEDAVKERIKGIRLGFGEYLFSKSPEVRRRSDYLPYRGWDCPDLLSAIYLQFYLFITSDKPVRFCEACGKGFPLTREDKRFCDRKCRSKGRNLRS